MRKKVYDVDVTIRVEVTSNDIASYDEDNPQEVAWLKVNAITPQLDTLLQEDRGQVMLVDEPAEVPEDEW